MSILQHRRSAVVYVAGLVSGLALAALLGIRPWESEATAQTESDSNLAANVAELRKSVQNLREKVDSSKEQVATLEELLEDVLLGDIHVGNADKLDGLDGSAYRLTCASGDVLFLGLCFELTTRTADSHSDAQRDCGGDGRRMPSEGELRALRDSDVDVTLASSEWTDELSDTDVAGSFLYAVVGTSGSGVDESIENYPYRCVGGPIG